MAFSYRRLSAHKNLCYFLCYWVANILGFGPLSEQGHTRDRRNGLVAQGERFSWHNYSSARAAVTSCGQSGTCSLPTPTAHEAFSSDAMTEQHRWWTAEGKEPTATTLETLCFPALSQTHGESASQFHSKLLPLLGLHFALLGKYCTSIPHSHTWICIASHCGLEHLPNVSKFKENIKPVISGYTKHGSISSLNGN